LPEIAMTVGNLDVPMEQIQAFCRKWKIAEFSLFDSVLRDDFSPASDVDVLVSFAPGGEMAFEGFIEMRQELAAILEGRQIDLVEKNLVRNPFRRHAILTTRQVVYAA
jgi:predicted nucleotidyltransferase